MKTKVPDLKKWRCSIFVLLIGLFICSNGIASLEYCEVTVKGQGPTLEVAINKALLNAIGQVNGKMIDSSTILLSSECAKETGNNLEYVSSELSQRNISTATKGLVSSYKVLDSSKTENGSWHVCICAKIARYKSSKKSKRKRIAIMPLRVSRNVFSLNGCVIDKKESARLLAEKINARLVQSRRFTVLDRDYQQETLKEKNLILSGDVPMEELVRLGERLVADYIIVGTIESINIKLQQKKFPSGHIHHFSKGLVSVTFRVVDLATHQVVLAAVLDIPVSIGDSSGIISVVLNPVANKISEKILNSIYPLMVVQVNGSQIVLGQGGGGIKEGSVYKVYHYGKRIVDPYNKEFLGYEEIYCATIEIQRVLPKMSYAKVLTTKVDLVSIFSPKTLICRFVSEKKKQEKGLKKRKLENEW